MEAVDTGLLQESVSSPHSSHTRHYREELLTDGSQSEFEALRDCWHLAHRVRATLGGAEAEIHVLDKSAEALYKNSVGISEALGRSLTTPERYALRAAAYLHDLGYFHASRPSADGTPPGFELLLTHGRKAVDLLESQYLPEESEGRIPVPAIYDEDSWEKLARFTLDLCESHAGVEGVFDDTDLSLGLVTGGGTFHIPVHRATVKWIFCLTEQLTGNHGFLLLADPLIPRRQRQLQDGALDDPVLELTTQYQAEQEWKFRVGCITGSAPGASRCVGAARERPRQGEEVAKSGAERMRRRIALGFQLARAKLAIGRQEFDLRLTWPSSGTGGVQDTEVCENVLTAGSLEQATLRALEELFAVRFAELSELGACRVAHSLDCLALYTLPHYPRSENERPEPSLQLARLRLAQLHLPDCGHPMASLVSWKPFYYSLHLLPRHLWDTTLAESPSAEFAKLEKDPEFVIGATARVLCVLRRTWDKDSAAGLSEFEPLVERALGEAAQGERGQIATYSLWRAVVFLAEYQPKRVAEADEIPPVCERKPSQGA